MLRRPVKRMPKPIAIEPMVSDWRDVYKRQLVDQIDSRMEIYREVLAPLKAGEFSQRVFALDNRRVYKHK